MEGAFKSHSHHAHGCKTGGHPAWVHFRNLKLAASKTTYRSFLTGPTKIKIFCLPDIPEEEAKPPDNNQGPPLILCDLPLYLIFLQPVLNFTPFCTCCTQRQLCFHHPQISFHPLILTSWSGWVTYTFRALSQILPLRKFTLSPPSYLPFCDNLSYIKMYLPGATSLSFSPS
jgi:hypothetical protein